MSASELRLDEACLAISSTMQSPLDEIEWLAALDVLAAECPDATPEGVAHHLFDDLAFRGNSDAYYDWRNSCLDRVIATRIGIPISLSVVMIEVAKRVGVDLVGVGMPAHFLVRTAEGPERYFDAFDGGVELDGDGARRLFESVTRGQASWQSSYLDPTSSNDIVIRMLNNLRAIFQGRSDDLRYGLVMQLRAQLPQLAIDEAEDIAAASAVFN